jgi:hypothetical protein
LELNAKIPFVYNAGSTTSLIERTRLRERRVNLP